MYNYYQFNVYNIEINIFRKLLTKIETTSFIKLFLQYFVHSKGKGKRNNNSLVNIENT